MYGVCLSCFIYCVFVVSVLSLGNEFVMSGGFLMLLGLYFVRYVFHDLAMPFCGSSFLSFVIYCVMYVVFLSCVR